MAAAVTPRCTISASSACRSVASGVVSRLGLTWPATRVSTPPASPVRWPAARSPDSSRNVVVDLPLVPVTPMSISRLDGSPYTQEATSPSRARGSATTNTGSPQSAARLFPSGSVSTATAPASAASSQNAAP